jgi:hypothetical protein
MVAPVINRVSLGVSLMPGGRRTLTEIHPGCLMQGPPLVRKERLELMNAPQPTPQLTPRLVVAVQDGTSGATDVARQVINGLLELTDEPGRLPATAELLAARLRWCAPMWHISRAAHAVNPVAALRSLRDRLDFDVDRSVAVAVKLLTERGCAVRAVRGSGLVAAVARALPEPAGARTVNGLVGADALGPTAMVNMVGTGGLARTVPTFIIATSMKLVPEESFRRLRGSGLERVPLRQFEAVVLDGEVLTPAEAGQRAAKLC